MGREVNFTYLPIGHVNGFTGTGTKLQKTKLHKASMATTLKELIAHKASMATTSFRKLLAHSIPT